MWIPIRADLRALANAFIVPEGRRAVWAALIGMVGMGFGSLALFGRLALARPIRDGIAAGDPTAYLFMCWVVVIVPLVLAAGLSIVSVRKELFDTPQATMMMIAPLGRLAIVGRAWIRLLFGAVLVGIAFGLPPAARAVYETPARGAMLALFPLVAITIAAPLVALAMLWQVVRARFLTGPRIRFAIHAIGVGGCLAFTVIALMGFLASRDQVQDVAQDLMQSGFVARAQAWSLASWLARAAGASVTVSWVAWVWPPLVAGVAVFVASRLVRGAFARAAIVEPGLVRKRFKGLGRAWPSHPLPSIAWKDACGMLQERASIVALVFFFGLQLVLMKTGLYQKAASSVALPPAFAHALAMLISMQLLSVFLGGLQSLSIVGSERKQASILTTAPIAYPVILAGKSLLIMFPFVWCALACAVGAPLIAGAPFSALLVFLPLAIAVILFNTGVIVAVGTWPPLFAVDEEVPISNSLQSIVPTLLTTIALGFSIGATAWFRSKLVKVCIANGSDAAAPRIAWATAGAVAVGAIVAGVGFWIGTRHLRRIFGPRW